MKKITTLFFFFMSTIAWTAGDYQQGQMKAMVCAACHGNNGVSMNTAWPHLASQHQTYLIKQLNDFKSGKLRSSPVMAPFVAGLDEQDIASLALFFSKQTLDSSDSNENTSRGMQLYRGGDLNKQITACIACHGPDGKGNELAGFPSLKGQQVDYTLQQLQAFKTKARKNDLNSIMQTIASRMSEEDMRAVAIYLTQMQNSQ